MIKNYLFTVLLFSCFSVFASNIETPLNLSATLTGGATVCQNSGNVTLTFTGIGGTAPYTFNYTINGGTPQQISTTGNNSSINLNVNTNNSGTFTYAIVSVIDSQPPNNPVTVTGVSQIITISPASDANMTSDVESVPFQGFTTFRVCANTPTEILFFNSSSLTSTNINYTINWGDGSPNFTASSWTNTSHTYQIGLWSLTYTVTNQSGCTTSRTYRVFVGNNPAVGLGNPGDTDICISSALTFPITGTENNPPGTTYVVSFNDGSPNQTFNHPPPSSISHTFLTSSCGTSSSSGANTFQNSFFASITAINPCDQSAVTVVPIRISTPPVANFNLPQNQVCTGVQICMENTSTGGDAASNTGCTTPKVVWIITPNTGFTLVSGTLGNDNGQATNTNPWVSGSQIICPVFNTPGVYTIRMRIGNRCGVDEIIRTLCVESVITPQFTVSNDTGCVPFAVTTSNNTNISNTCSPVTYDWQVNYTAAYCGTSSGFSFTGGTNASSASPSFNFTQPGIYTLSLTTTNACGSATTTRTINVLRPPTVELAPLANACGPVSITPNATVNGCAPTGTALTYNWSFPGGTPSSSSSANPGTIQYTSPGTYSVSLTVSNSCGSSNVATQSFTITPIPEITNTSLTQTICSGLTTTPVTITATPPGTTFSWTATGSAGVSGFTASGSTATIPAQTILTTGTTPGQVVYVITPTFNGCQGPAVNYTVIVNPAPIITAQPVSSTVCLGGNPSPMTVAITPATPGVTYQWFSNLTNSNTGGTPISGATNATFTPTTTTVGTIYYYAVITVPGTGCNSLNSNTGSVTVEPLPIIATQPTNTQSICVGGVVPALTVSYTGGLGTPSYQWFSNTSPSNSGGNAIAGATSSSYTPPVFNTAGTFYYYVQITLTGTGCGSIVSQLATVEVVPDPVIDAQPLASQTQCQGAPATPLEVTVSGGLGTVSYQWFSNTVNNTTSGTLIPGATSSSYIPTTDTVGTLFYYVIATQAAPGCSVTCATAQVQVVPAPTVSTQPLASQTVCLGGATTPLTVAFVNGIGTPTYQWFSNTNNSNTGGTAITGATTDTFTPPSSAEGTVYYYVVITFSSGGCTSATSATATVTVTPLPEIDTQPTSTQSICVGGVVPVLTVSYTGGLGTPSYQWFSNTSPSNSGGNAIAGATSSSYTPPVFNTAGTFYYYVQITLTGTGCGSIVSQLATVEVVPDPVIDAQPLASQTQCQGAPATPLEVTVSGGLGTVSYQWFSNTVNNTTSGTLIPGATSSSYIPTTDTVGTLFYYVIATQAAPGCSVTSATAQVQVVPAPTVSTQPLASQTVCLGGATTPLTVAFINGIGTPTYQWFSNTNNSNTGGTAITGATTDTFTPPSSAEGTVYYYVVITFSSGGCTSATSATATVTVTPLPEIDTQPTSTQSICVGGVVPALTVSYTGGLGTPSYQWFSNTSPSNSGGTAIAGATSSSYTPPVFNTAGTFYYYVQITLTGTGCGSIVSQLATVEVVPDPVIDAQPLASQTQCQGAPATPLEVTVSGGLGTVSYQWFSNTVNNTTSGTLIPGATSSSYIPTTDTVGTLFYYVIATQAAPGCSVTSATAQVQVVPAPTVSTQPLASQTVCLGGATTPLTVAFINGIGTPTYQWFSNTNNSNTGGTAITGATTDTFTPPSSAEGTVYYYVVITFSSGGCTSTTSATATVTVTPLPEIDTQPTSTQSICVGGVVPALTVSYTGGLGTPSYQWFSNTSPSNSGGTAIAGATSSSYTPPVFNTAGIFYYYVQITLTGTGCGSIVSQLATVEVVPDPVTDAQPLASQTQCQGAPATPLEVTVSGGLGTVSYQWFSNTVNNTTSGTLIPGATGSSFTPPTDVVGTIFYYVMVTQSISGCDVVSNTAQVEVVPAPTITLQPQSDVVCEGGSLSPLSVAFTNGTGTASYQWFNSQGPIDGATTDTYLPSNVVSDEYFVVITFSSGGCTSITSDTANITIIPLPEITTQPIEIQTVCEGGNVPAFNVSFSGGTGNVSYQWFSNTIQSTNGGLAIVGAVNSTYTPPVFTTSGSYYFYVEISFDGAGCGSLVSALAEVNVIPDPVVMQQPLPNQTVCQNSPATPLSVIVSGGINSGFNYQWFVTPLNSVGSGTAVTGATSSEFFPPTDVAGTLYYYALITQTEESGCSVFSEVAAVVVNLAPEVTIQPNSNVYCLGDVSQPLSYTVINGVGTPSIQWFSNTTAAISGGIEIPGATSTEFIPSTSEAGVFYYYAVIYFPSLIGDCSTVNTEVASITVNQIPVISDEAITICSENPFEIIPANQLPNIIPAGTVYTWNVLSITPTGSITGASDSTIPQTAIGQFLINTTTNPATVVYEVTPTSGDCVGSVFQVVVTVNPAISPNVICTNSTCFQVDNGSITTNIIGGIPPYVITWTGPNGFSASSPSISNLMPGTYTLLIEDTGDCPYTESFLITEPDAIQITTVLAEDISCFGFNNGAIEIEVSGGTPEYSYTWTKNNVLYSNDANLSNLGPGTYELTVTDTNNCGPASMVYKISEPPLLEVNLINQVNIECFGQATGAIDIQAVGGTISNEYNFNWSGPNGYVSTAQNIQNLFAGTYQLLVTDDNGCEASLTVVLTQSPEIIISYTTTPISCYGANDASLSVTLSGGVPPFQFTWNNLSTSLNQNNLSAGDYIITVTDALGCVRVETINIPEAPVFMVNPIVNQISCFGANNGSINLNLTGGIPPVTLQWSDGSTAGLIRNNLPPGTYTATIADGTPCFIVRTFTIIEPQPLVISAVLTQPTDCLNAASGAINLIVSGGTPPFAYQWSNGVTTEDLAGVVAGNYGVTVTDANGCTISGQFTLIRPNPLVVSVTSQTDADCETREVLQFFTAQGSGGVPPYTYQWSSGTVSGTNNQVMQTSINGMVILTVTDALGCTTTFDVNVQNPVIGNPNIATESFGFLTYGIYSINDPIQFFGNVTGDYLNVIWDFGDGTFSNELNPVHTYELEREYIVTMTVTYPFGCVYVLTISLLIEKGYLLVIPNAFTPNNDGLNDTFRPVSRYMKSVRMDVYDSWGSMIYSETGDSLVGWDGRIKGVNAQNGNYYAVVTAETFYGRIIQQNQTFVLIK
jgi:large repetitive protein